MSPQRSTLIKILNKFVKLVGKPKYPQYVPLSIWRILFHLCCEYYMNLSSQRLKSTIMSRQRSTYSGENTRICQGSGKIKIPPHCAQSENVIIFNKRLFLYVSLNYKVQGTQCKKTEVKILNG